MRRRLLIDLNLTICVILGLFVVFLFTFKLDGGNLNPKDEEFSEGWVYEDGTPVDFMNLRFAPEGETISKVVSSDQVSGADLCFESRSLFFTVYVDGTAVYDFHPELMRLYGKYYGECIHAVDIPTLEDTSVIEISYTSLYEGGNTTFHYMKIQEGAAFIRSMVAKNFVSYLECFVIMVLGVSLIVIGFILNRETDRIIETVSLGATAIILALWTSSGSRIPQLITQNPAIVRVMDYLTLMFLPVPVIIFVASVTKQLETIIPKIIVALVGLNLTVTFLWVMVFGKDYADMLIVTHIVIGIGIVFTVYMTSKALKRTKKVDKDMGTLIAGFSVLIASGILDGIRYYLYKTPDSSLFTRIGLFYFVLLFTIYELNLFISMSRKSAQTEIMEKLAFNDGLTGLYNRLAFTQDENLMANEQSGKYILIQLDINYLKTVNDNYGHAEGDRFIIAAAKVISSSFERFGKCYRIGGDEFFVIMKGKNCEDDYRKAVSDFENALKKINEAHEFPIPLQIAYGKSVYVPGKDSLEEVEKIADKLMYERKSALKAGATNT